MIEQALAFESRPNLLRRPRDLAFRELCVYLLAPGFVRLAEESTVLRVVQKVAYKRRFEPDELQATQNDMIALGFHTLTIFENESGPCPHSLLDADATAILEGLLFKHLQTGVPVVVRSGLSRFQAQWTAEAFIEKYGSQKCTVEDCEHENTRLSTTVSQFFRNFGQPVRTTPFNSGSGIWKLKDWPPQAELKSMFPELYQDYMQGTLFPEFTSFNGVYNLTAHFPVNALKSDLGPKMYNAFSSVQEEGHHGSTRLHLDVCDAVNYMTYSMSPTSSTTTLSSAVGAEWIIVHRDDTERLVHYLREINGDCLGHPIHLQKYFLSAADIREIVGRGIRVFRIQQRTGDAVFIPSGCAHQVSNISDAIKVAFDFLSPAALPTCRKLAAEFREHRLLRQDEWPNDLLQIDLTLYFAYRSLERLTLTQQGIRHRTEESPQQHPLPRRRISAHFTYPSQECGEGERSIGKSTLVQKKLRRPNQGPFTCPVATVDPRSSCDVRRTYLVSGLLDHLRDAHQIPFHQGEKSMLRHASRPGRLPRIGKQGTDR
ncbi:hypothetical protein NM688_g4456 [Phlebia brevispora]|uniref:Uncharacterized protein n=1 Tax=Phlebia brevispora TaxID=194682 RepID=A0ACC1T2V5_9APHY|nr:hypothetical protein NM688_g4456 [Phlebia brevispora]